MKAVVARGKGGPDVLELEEVPDPHPADDELLVRVEAAGINHIDLTWRAGGGIEFPAILGVDAASRIEPTGERVLVTGIRGTYEELVAAKKDNVFPIPDELDATAAAALGVPYKTAWWSLVDMGGLKEGHTLLVQGAATATGQACIDVGRVVGARVYATTRREKLDKARELGAEPLEYGDSKLRDLKANVVFDPVGAETFADSVGALGREGVLVTPGRGRRGGSLVQHLDAARQARTHTGNRCGAGLAPDDGRVDRDGRERQDSSGHRPRAPTRASRRGASRNRGARDLRQRDFASVAATLVPLQSARSSGDRAQPCGG